MSDDISEAMVSFLRQAEELLDVPNAVSLVFDLGKMLGEHSYGDLNYGSGYGERLSDRVIDEILEELAPGKRLEEPEWNFVKDL